MPIYRKNDRVILFIHIPKTGGSTIEKALDHNGTTQALKHSEVLEHSLITPQHMHWEITRAWLPEKFYDFAFAVVRNPVSRMVSEYRWQCTFSNKSPPRFSTWAKQVIEMYRENSYIFDNHIRPQNEFIGPGVEVFRFEDGLEKPICAGFRELGFDQFVPHIPHEKKSARNEIIISSETLDRIRHFYQDDYEAFGYDPETTLPSGLRLACPSPLYRCKALARRLLSRI